MLLPTLLTLLSTLLLSTALALPNPNPNPIPQTTGNGATSPIGNPRNTTITYYQGTTTTESSSTGTTTNSTTNSTSPTCGTQAVATGSLNSSICVDLHTYSAAIASLPDVDCVFALYKGSAGCQTGAGVNVTYVPIARGEGMQACVVDGVLDGGMMGWTVASGVWVCG